MAQQPSDDEILELGNGVRRHQSHDGRIVWFTFRYFSRETAATWFAARREYIRAADPNRMVLTLHDFSEINLGNIRPGGALRYAIEQENKFDRFIPENLSGRTAVIIPNNTLMQIIEVIANQAGRMLKGRFDIKIFRERDSALDWLEEALTPPDVQFPDSD